MKKVKLVLDTNILVSMFIFPGCPPEEIFKMVVHNELDLGISESILNELKKVLITKFHYHEVMAKEVLNLIQDDSILVNPLKIINILKDDPDNRILECALEFRADYIISGDKHLLSLKEYKSIKIISASNFLKLLY